MAFNQQGFMAAQYQPRTAEVDVISLAQFFDDLTDEQLDWVTMTKAQRIVHIKKGGVPQVIPWVVRGQTACEVALAKDAALRNTRVSNVVDAISSTGNQVSDIKQALGISSDTPPDIVIRLEQLVTCSVNPEIDLPCAVKLADTHPGEFYILTNKIVELTALGMDIKKPGTSGKM